MRITVTTAAAALLAISSHCNAQGWSITAHAPVSGTATAQATFVGFPAPQYVTNGANLPVGPVQSGVFLSSNATTVASSASTSMSWVPSIMGSTAPLQLTARASGGANAQFGYPFQSSAGGSASGNAEIILTLRAPQPVSGRLFVRISGLFNLGPPSSSVSSIRLDVNADGSFEVSSPPPVGYQPTLNLPLQIPATGAVIKLIYGSSSSLSCSGAVGCLGVSSNMKIEAQFFPGEPVVASFATFSGAATMSFDQGSQGMVTLSIGSPLLTPIFMVIGGTPISVPLLPSVTALVSPDIVIATPSGSLTLLTTPLPPGTALFVQGLVADAAGTPRGTNSVRALWP
jgi:hypothetical protein